jgi:nucleotide-binding universal stress UspA family protein
METLPNPNPNPTPAQTVRHVLLATDTGAASARAADAAIKMAADQQAVLLILSVVPPDRLPHLGNLHDPEAERERRDRRIRDLARRAASRGVTAACVLWYGDPAEAILEAARTQRADVVVLGSRKRTDLGRILLGSVSSHVVDGATCPVVVVPA